MKIKQNKVNIDKTKTVQQKWGKELRWKIFKEQVAHLQGKKVLIINIYNIQIWVFTNPFVQSLLNSLLSLPNICHSLTYKKIWHFFNVNGE